MDISLANIDPGWLEVVLTGIGLVLSLILGYQFGRRDPLEPCVTLNRQQALDLVRVYHRSVASDIVRSLRRALQRIEERGREPSEEEFREMRREVTALIRERRELLHNFRMPWGRLDRALTAVYDAEGLEEDYEEIRRILLSDGPLLERLERVEKTVWETQMAMREQLDRQLLEHEQDEKTGERKVLSGVPGLL